MTVNALRSPTWESLSGLRLAGWLWLDMTEGGLHRGPALPSDPPSQLSHLWGWSGSVLVRVRADISLPTGFVGATVALADAGAGTRVPLWGSDPGRVQIVSREFHGPSKEANVTLTQYTCSVTNGADQMPLVFYRMEDEHA